MPAILLAAKHQKDIGPYLIWVGGLIIAVVVLGLIVMYLRRNLLSGDSAAGQGGLLDDLRGMRDRGEISLEEYDRARRRMVAKISGQPEAEAPRPQNQKPGTSKPGASTPQASNPRAPNAKPGAGSASEVKARAPAPDGTLIAKPGYDLTGAPLPRPGQPPPAGR